MSKVALGEFIDFKNGKAIKQSSGKIPIYGGNGILGYTDVSNYENTIIIGRVGAYCGSVHMEKNSCWVSDNAIAGIVSQEKDLKFFYYLLKSLGLNSKQIGSSQPLITQTMLKNMVVDIELDLQKQKLISGFLDNIDQKIALNNQINEELEAMAKTLYDYWFVQFDFPDENGKPYKTSGGKMVYDDQLKREIPEGWGVENLSNFLTIKNGKDHKDLSDGDYPVYGSGGLMRKVEDYIFEGESVLIPRKGTLNNIMYVDEKFWTVDTMFYTHMKIDYATLYTYFSIKDIDFTKLNTGTGVPSMTASILYQLQILNPNADILKKFDELVRTTYRMIFDNHKQNQELTQLRDWLLPMLMNGQVKVEE